jgi:hypothetical protein
MTMAGKQPSKRRSGSNRSVAFILSSAVERALLVVLHDVETEKVQRATWDEAFRRLLAEAGRPVEEDEPQ